MATLPRVSQKNNILKAGGILTIARRGPGGQVFAARNVGNAASVTLSREEESSETTNYQDGRFETLQKWADSTSYAINAEVMNMTMANFALILAADVELVTPDTTEVVDEELYGPIAGGMYWLGATESYPSGVGALTEVDAIEISAPARADSTPYAVGDVFSNATIAYVVTASTGSSGATAPTYPTNGGTATDGDLTIKHLGPVAVAANTEYVVDLERGVVQLMPGNTALMTSISRMPAGHQLVLLTTYTPTGTPYQRTIPLDEDAEYQVRFTGQTPKGEPLNFVAGYCAISGSGESEFINQENEQTVTFTITPLSRVSGVLPVESTSKVFNEWVNA